jgi:hypothetical protein
MTDSKIRAAAPQVDVDSKYGKVTFTLWTANSGSANFEPFKLRGVEYSGTVWFKDQADKWRAPTNCRLRRSEGHDTWKCDSTHFDRIEINHSNTWFRRTENLEHPTDAARREVIAFVEAEAAKLFDDAKLVQTAHVAQIERMVKEQQSEIDALALTLDKKSALLTERMKQAKLGTPFCVAESRNGYSEICVLPEKHAGEHEWGKR